MAKYRSGRLAEEFKREISAILKDDLKDPRIGFVSVVSAEVSADLHHAKVWVSVMGDEETVRECMAALKKAAGYVRREIARRIDLRHTPEIEFIYDDSIVHGAKITQMLREVLPPVTDETAGQTGDPGRQEPEGPEDE